LPADNRSSLVLGAIRKLDRDAVAPFVESLRATGYDGDVVFLTTRISGETRAYLASRGVATRPFLFFKPWHGPIHTARYFGFDRFLTREGGKYDRVLVADVRDVVFQRDPFAGRDWLGVHAFLESARAVWGHNPLFDHLNDKFLTPAETALLRDRPVSCCGTVIADARSMTALIAAMVKRYRGLPLMMKHKLGPDTVFHNLFIHDGSRPCTLHPNNGQVATMAYEARGAYRLVDGFGIALADGTRPPICHQYDRYPEIAAAIRKEYSARAARPLPGG
jgi:hypothetical protein